MEKLPLSSQYGICAARLRFLLDYFEIRQWRTCQQ